jgi:CheY-like chemotaxis protein
MLNGVRVLAVDAALDSAELYRTFLQTKRADVRLATSGKEALAGLRPTWVPHALVTDLRLPDMDGFDLARRLREQKAFAGALVGISSESRPGVLARVRAAGFAECLIKPVELAKLAATIAEAVERLRTPAA